MESAKNPNEVKIALKELVDYVSRLDEKIEGISSQLEILSENLLPKSKPEIVEYMQKTIDAMAHLDEINQRIPVSRIDLANELDIHPNTAYIRAEKLVEKNKFLKYYGRGLGREKFEEKKAVYYSLFRTLYDHKTVAELEKKNKSAYMIALTLLQQQPITENDLIKTDKLTEKEIKQGLYYLVSRGFISKETKNKAILYRIRKIDQEGMKVT
ncbi:MAG: hypothetical protein HeimC3_07760 [Candidatus Heimdallarchaeota archaeon LC_3]|nr:MAG: hypothetical protein HeimC3_07760 [Candidatus Heimdallarchaeota archaeon LC_3]